MTISIGGILVAIGVVLLVLALLALAGVVFAGSQGILAIIGLVCIVIGALLGFRPWAR